MVTTGIVRKIDNLGRIVLPKELRYSLSINSGDDFEILIDGDKIILKRYSKINENKDKILKLLDNVNKNINFKILLIVNNKFINNDYIINDELKLLINERKIYKNEILVNKLLKNDLNNVVYPVIMNSDLLCTLIAFGNENTDYIENILKLVVALIKDLIN